MNKFFAFVRFVGIAFLLGSSAAQAGIGDELGLSPFWDWKEINTPNFRIVFPAPLAARAQRSAELFEQAHADLKIDLRWEPWHRVNVLLVDNTDAANGMATPVSRFGMLLYLTPPDPFFSTDYYDDWLKLLIYHEYTHFLNMDATGGLYNVARVLFGDVLLPNSAWPSWMLEGYAVYNETKYTRGGRGRSPYWEGVLRTAVEAAALDRSSYVKLDQVNGPQPRYPAGENAYLFGYHLMNTAERTRKNTLSEMTERSATRVPFFINGNVENITGKDWYALWDAWVKSTNERLGAQLATIKRQPVSKIEVIDGTRDETFGVTFSPDGSWIAYSFEYEHHWQALKLRRMGGTESEARMIEDKFFGSTMAFTPDSQRLVYSSLHRKQNYYFLSDLRVHDLKSGETYWLTDGARARDPDISRDGKWIVFTEASDGGVDLVMAKLAIRDGRLRLEGKRKLVDAASGDRIANARFAPDQKSIVFAWKKEGELAEGLYRYSFAGGAKTDENSRVTALVADGAKNRFPAFDAKNSLYYVSDRTGVDNLYRLDHGRSTMVTNVTGALWLPAFHPKGDLYASVLKKEGFSAARVEMTPSGFDVERARIQVGSEAPAVAVTPPSTKLVKTTYAVEDYSALSTLLPRQWAPFFISTLDSTYAGGQVFGYDNTFRHQYFGFGAHDSTAKLWDYSVAYENRSFGPTLALSASKLTSDTLHGKNTTSGLTSFTRETNLGAKLSFPFQGTISELTPEIGFHLEQEAYYEGPAGGQAGLLFRTRRIPEQDVSLTYANTRSSREAVAPERGGRTTIGTRRYDLGAVDIYKGIFKHTQYLHLGNHTVFFPTLKAAKVNRRDFSFLDASALSRGRRDRITNPLFSDHFDEFGIRGYPQLTVSSRESITLSADIRFQLMQISRGWGTNPLFFNQLSLQLFAEDTYRPAANPAFQHLPSAGAGLKLDIQAFLHLPLSLGVDYHYGFNDRLATGGDLFFSVTASSLLPF